MVGRSSTSRHVASIRGKGEFRPLSKALGYLRLGQPSPNPPLQRKHEPSPFHQQSHHPTAIPLPPLHESPHRGNTQPSTAYIRYGTILLDRAPFSRPRPRPRRHPPSSRPRMSPGRLPPAPDSSHSPMEDLPRYLLTHCWFVLPRNCQLNFAFTATHHSKTSLGHFVTSSAHQPASAVPNSCRLGRVLSGTYTSLCPRPTSSKHRQLARYFSHESGR